MFLGTWKGGAILLSLSVLYGDDGIEHRIRDSQPRVIVTDAENAEREHVK
jgi:acetyl-CoA synthetase